MEQQPTTMKREVKPMNGVDTPTLFATINAVSQQPDLAQFTFRASSTWVGGTHTRSRAEVFDGAGGQHRHSSEIQFDADHPTVLVGTDRGAAPVEFMLHGLAACLTAGIGNIAAARGVTLSEVTSTVEGQIDLRGILGISDEVRNGYQRIKVNFRIKGDAPAEKLRQIVEQSRARSAVYDVLTNGVPVEPRPAPAVLDLEAEGIRSVIWATGFERRYPFLKVPVLDERGEIRHRGGVTAVPGLYVLGLTFMRRRKSTYIDGVGDDAEALAGHLLDHLWVGRWAA